jgi:AraC-like DNA-binding protein
MEGLRSEWVSSAWGADKMIDAANAFFLARIPRSNPKVRLATELVQRITDDRQIKTVDDLADRAGLDKRRLQRIFNEYVGIGLKWVIRRVRLHDIVEMLNSGAEPDWSQVALELGYFDQAHLINEFGSIVGESPARFQRASATR